MTTRTNDGFTLIELIVVIAVLAILAAVALPKFANFTNKAETASFDGVQGGLSAAVGMVHAKWLIDNKVNPVQMDGVTVDVNTAGWPTLDQVGQLGASEVWGKIMAGPVPSGWTTNELTTVDIGWSEYDPPFSTAAPPAGFGTDVLRYEEVGGKVCRTTASTVCP